jgi:PhnB protein
MCVAVPEREGFDRPAKEAGLERRRPVPKVDTYLSFDGTAAQAMRAYEQILGAKLEILMKFGDAPSGMRGPPGSDDKVMHGQLSFKNGDRLMASDWIGGQPYEGMKGFSVALSYETASEARTVFDALVKGGMAILPMQQSFFAEAFGMLIDRFGTPWTISGGTSRT